MHLLLTIFSLTAVVIIASREARLSVELHDVKQFCAGQQYHYQLDTQISSGFATVSDQLSITRLQAQVYFQFLSDRKVILTLDNIKMGSLNRDISEPGQVHPMQMFKKVTVGEEYDNVLRLPVTFDYVEGIIEALRFHRNDNAWSKNIKRSVLNMIQSNIKQRKGLADLNPRKEVEFDQQVQTEQTTDRTMFTLPEITLEGECQTSYTINKVIPLNKYSDRSENKETDARWFNVTKSIDFKSCRKIADIRFGPQIEKPCANCNVEKLEEKKLDRTTVIRQVFVGDLEKFGIQHVELVSHYMFRMINAEAERPMFTVVAGELNYIKANEERQSRNSETKNMGQETQLIYSIEWETNEKRFYMYGDEKFPDNSPFKDVTNKINQIEKLIIRLVTLWSDKIQGIESEATGVFIKIVELVRMCTGEELLQVNQILNHENDRIDGSARIKAGEIFVDALSNAGTYNTIKFLVEKIISKEIEGMRAVRAITHLKGLPVPSEKQINMLLRLCTSEVAHRSSSLKQTCWLTTGAIIGELCNNEITREDGFERNLPKSNCQREQQQTFVKALLGLHKRGETRYEEILALKALGNAGLVESTLDLETIICDVREDFLVRIQAIDSLRRICAIMPRRIQRILLPIFQNIRERPEIRMAAISMILSTIPDNSIMDQIGYTLLKEPSHQVKSYVYSAMKHTSESPVVIEKQLSKHLKSLLHLAGITEETEEKFLRGSWVTRIPFYSVHDREGILSELESIVGPDNYLPKKLTASIDTLFSGILEKDGLEISLNQENLENWYHKIYDVLNDQFSLSNRKYTEFKAFRKSDDRDKSSEESQDRVDSIYSSLKIKKRIQNQLWNEEYDSNKRTSPYGMLTFRYANIDTAILPIEEEILPKFIKNMVSGKKPTISDVEDFLHGKHFRVQCALNLLDYTVKIPTSMGLPISMIHVVPILWSIDGTAKTKFKHDEVAIETQIHAILTTTHLKRTEVWCPFVITGAETSQTIEINLPVNTELKVETSGKKCVVMTLKVPETKTQLFGLHTLPHTYVSEVDKSTKLPRMPSVKCIQNNRLQQQQRSIEKVYGDMTLRLPVKVYGDIYMPHDVTSYKKIVNTLLTSENHLHVEFNPTGDSPREIKLVIDGEAFSQHNDLSTHRQLKGFYSKAKFDDEHERYYQSENENENENEQFDTFLNDYTPRKMYKHQCRIQLLTVGGKNEKYGQIEAEAACDERVKFCQSVIKITRSPFYQENREWSMKIEAQSFYPEYVEHIYELEKLDVKNQKFVSKVDMEWGSDRKQEISVLINGKQFKPKRWIQKISRIDEQDYSYSSLSEQMKLKIAFLNKFDISVDSKLQPHGENIFSKCFAALKAWDFWSTQIKPINGRDGSFFATVIIDPITHENVNITIKTPSEKVLIDSLCVPIKIKPFELVRNSQYSLVSSNSLIDTVRSYNPKTNPECKVDDRKVQTFDEVTYKASLSKCYSVLAKDCSSENPKFAVLMKKLNDKDMKLKMIIGKQIIEVKPDTNGKLIVKINGDRIVDVQELLDYGIDCTDNKVIIDTQGVVVRFNGQKIWIKLDQTYKNTQCGLCGHYNDDIQDEFRMANNEHTYDLKGFHQSYTLEDEECRPDMQETYRHKDYRRLNLDEYNSLEEQKEKKNKEPIEKTQIVEYNHKVCFSVTPIKECPRRTKPNETEEKKVNYQCFERDSPEAHEYLRMIRRNPKTKLDLLQLGNPSYIDTIQVPISCVSY